MPGSPFNPKDGFDGPDVPEVEAPEPQGLRRPERARSQRKLPWVFTFVGYIILAAIGAAATLVAFLALKVA